MRQSEDEKERRDKKEDSALFKQMISIIRANGINLVKLSVIESLDWNIINLCKSSSMLHVKLCVITSAGIYFSLRKHSLRKHSIENVANIFREHIGKSIWRYEVDNRINQSV